MRELSIWQNSLHGEWAESKVEVLTKLVQPGETVIDGKSSFLAFCLSKIYYYFYKIYSLCISVPIRKTHLNFFMNPLSILTIIQLARILEQ
jgi:hypothetical protein